MFSQDYSVEWHILQNVQMFLGNLTVALAFGAVFSVAWELPLAKLQKLGLGAFAAQLSKRPTPPWTLGVLGLLVLSVILFILNFIGHLPLSKLTSAWW